MIITFIQVFIILKNTFIAFFYSSKTVSTLFALGTTSIMKFSISIRKENIEMWT